MAHAQKSYFFFRRNGRVHLNQQGCQFSRILAAEVCASAVVMLDTPSSEVVKGTGYPLLSPVSPSLPLPFVTVCHHVSTGLYHQFNIHKFYVLPTQFMYVFVWIWEQTAIISLHSINLLVFITEMECVYCAVRTGSSYTIILMTDPLQQFTVILNLSDVSSCRGFPTVRY